MFLGYLDNGSRRHQRSTSTAERAVGHDVNAFLITKINNLLLRKSWVVLNLVDGWDHSGMGQKLLQVSFAVLSRCERSWQGI